MPRRPSEHVDSPAAVGARLRAAREAAGLTQRDLSFDGCTPAYVSRIEAGARTPSLQILRKFGERLGVSADYLATGGDGIEKRDGLIEAEIALHAGDLDRAEELFSEAHADASSASHLARAAAGLGLVALARGDTSRASELLEPVLAGDDLPRTEATPAVSQLTRLYCAQGRFADAFALLDRFLERARATNDRFEIVTYSFLLANAYIDSGNFSRAEAVLGDALAGAREMLDPRVRANLYWSQSRLYSSEGRPDLAAHYIQLAVATLKATEDTVWAARALLLYAFIEIDRGHGQEALDLIEEARPILASSGDEVEEAVLEIERARALSLVGDEEEAVSLMLGLVPRLAEARPANAEMAYSAAADFFHKRGDTARALELYELAVERAPVRDRHVADALTAMAEIHEERGDATKALALIKAALAARSDVGALIDRSPVD
jgi:tetratricopeptide (TPR) repeat protein